MGEIPGVLLLLVGLQAKHFLADFVLQTPDMLANRHRYGHPGGLMHVAVHLALSTVVLGVAGTSLPMLAALIAAEALVHYHVDWAKDNFGRARQLTPDRQIFWVAMGVDQALHHLTYLGMVWAWSGM